MKAFDKNITNIFFNLWQIAVLVLIILCIVGAFLGTQAAGAMFGGTGLLLFWALISLLAAAAVLIWLKESLGAILVFGGVIFIICGAMWGSPKADTFRRQYLGIDKIHSGKMMLESHAACDTVFISQDAAAKLGFALKLDSIDIEYHPDRSLKRSLCNISVIKDRQTVKTAKIEANKPLHYGGYYFYLSSPHGKDGNAAVLTVRSDSGSVMFYIGLFLLAGGVIKLCLFERTRTQGGCDGN